jgi:hypothetical protein
MDANACEARQSARQRHTVRPWQRLKKLILNDAELRKANFLSPLPISIHLLLSVLMLAVKELLILRNNIILKRLVLWFKYEPEIVHSTKTLEYY